MSRKVQKRTAFTDIKARERRGRTPESTKNTDSGVVPYDPVTQWLPGGRLADDVVAVRFERKTKNSNRDAILREADGLPLQFRIEIAGESYILVRSAEHTRNDKKWLKNATMTIAKAKGVVRVAPVFAFGWGYAVATDKLIVRTACPVREHSSQFYKMGGQLIQRRQKIGVLRIPARADPMEVAVTLGEQDWVKDVMPDFVIVRWQPQGYSGVEIEPPNWQDRDAPGNYALRVTGAYDALNEGYHGNPAIRIAIIDSGVDTDHADLTSSIRDRWDATDRDNYQEPTYGDDHGTAVAGIAVGMPDSAIGVHGVGSGCSLIPIKIGRTAPKGVEVSYFTHHILHAVHLAWDYFHADVICLSFGLPYSGYLEVNINNALTRGRGGKGCVVVAATGNNGGPTCFPASLSDVLAVTATNQFDEFKDWNSQDGETRWASSFGPEADIAAPGVALPSAANTNQDGQRIRRYGIFSGSSFAAPQVAGLAGLILSVNPNLPGAHVRDIIKNTAEKKGKAPYQGGRNDFFGYGRINIANAVDQTPR